MKITHLLLVVFVVLLGTSSYVEARRRGGGMMGGGMMGGGMMGGGMMGGGMMGGGMMGGGMMGGGMMGGRFRNPCNRIRCRRGMRCFPRGRRGRCRRFPRFGGSRFPFWRFFDSD